MPVYYFGNHRYWTSTAADFNAAEDAPARLVFAHATGCGLTDGFIKNTYEVLAEHPNVSCLW